MASLRVVYFAAARELAGCDSEELQAAGALTEPAFRAWLGQQKPRLAPYLPRMRLAVNGEFAGPDAVIAAGDEVTVLPPVAGGSRQPLAAVRTGPLSIDEAFRAVQHPAAGGVCLFVGVVRDHADGKSVARLDYEAYEELANKEMQRILSTLEAELPGARLAATHRVGELLVGDLAVVVAASAPHRAQAFDACRKAIDRIKETVPVWKKEWSADGQAVWVNLSPQSTLE